MKPFDLEKAKAGAKLCTRDGRPARVICWDRKGCLPLVFLVDEADDEEERLFQTDLSGRHSSHRDDPYDLFLAPDKKEGWVNVYKYNDGNVSSMHIFSTYQEAKESIAGSGAYIDTVKIEWEE